MATNREIGRDLLNEMLARLDIHDAAYLPRNGNRVMVELSPVDAARVAEAIRKGT